MQACATPAPAEVAITPLAATTTHESTLTTPPTPSTQLLPAPFREDFHLSKGSRPNAGDYIIEVRDLLLLAIARYMVSIFTVNAFPDTVQQREFVTSAWDEVCAAQGSKIAWKLSERMIAVVSHSHLMSILEHVITLTHAPRSDWKTQVKCARRCLGPHPPTYSGRIQVPNGNK